MDELTVSNQNIWITLTKVALNLDKEIYLLRGFEEDPGLKKKYLRTSGVLIGDQLVTSTFVDSAHFMEELNLFDLGNDQNKYFGVVEHKKTKNLKLKIDDTSIFISKSEAKTMYKLYNMSMIGYSLARVMEFEFRLTPESIAEALYHHDFLCAPDLVKL